MDEKEDAQRPAESAPAATPSPIPPPIDPPPVAESAASEGDQAPEKMSKSDLIMSLATIVIALGTIVSAAAICLQWREMVNGGADTTAIKNAAEKQACAAQQFSDSAKLINDNVSAAVQKLGEQADNSRMFFKADERAWVEIGRIDKTVYPPDSGTGMTSFTVKFDLYFKNVGKTLARDVRISVIDTNAGEDLMYNRKGIRMFQDQLFRGWKQAKGINPPESVPGPQTLAPGEQSIVPVHSAGAQPKYGRYSYVMGRIRYLDTFGANHWKHFCYFVSDERGDLDFCQYGNDEDTNPEPAKNPK